MKWAFLQPRFIAPQATARWQSASWLPDSDRGENTTLFSIHTKVRFIVLALLRLVKGKAVEHAQQAGGRGSRDTSPCPLSQHA